MPHFTLRPSPALSSLFLGLALAVWIAPAMAESEREPSAPEHLRIATSPLTWTREPGQGLLLGYENGAWGESWAQGLRIGIPFSRHFALHARPLYVMRVDQPEDVPYTADLGGRIDVIGRSYAILNVVRLYGGGGFQWFSPVFNTEGRSGSLGGGGHFGFEFFQSPYYSFFLEIGGQGSDANSGATILAGMNFFPWTR